MKLLNFGDNAPLTFGIGHPVTERVERLHGQNKITLKSIVPVLTLTSAMVLALPITTLAADTDVNPPLVIQELPPIQAKIFSSKIVPARKETTNETPVLIVEARQIRRSVLPMEIVLRKKIDAQLNEEFLALHKSGQHDLAKKQEMTVLSHAFNYTGHLTITVQQSGQYGYKMANGKRNGYDVVHISPAFQTALQPIMKRCARQAQTSRLPLHFLTQLNVVANGMRTGKFRAQCTPGNVSQRQSLTIDEKIAGLRASTEIPIATRYARARGMRVADYIRKAKANTAMTEVQQDAADKLFLEKLERDFPYYTKSYK
ncbi:MAG: hypothetical protein COA43_12450 [Robiginitomaculum sp.]|nr:MAG: hypothetical protein COA43_12450 [Robiginitomaculum sp.]